MSLSTRLAGDFAGTVRRRGQNYVWQRLVRIDEGSDRAITARVTGSRIYDVGLRWEDGTLSAWCDCPYFVTEGPCKHLWATILAAEARGYLSALASEPDLLVDYVASDSDDPEDEPDQEPEKPAPPPQPPSRPRWLSQLEQISAPAPRDYQSGTPWRSDRQLLYVVDAASSNTSESVVLRLDSRDRRADGAWVRHGTPRLKRDQIEQIPAPEDREMLSFLVGASQYWGPYYGGAYETLPDSYALRHPLAEKIMRAAAQCERLYLTSATPGEFIGPLQWDESGGPWQFALEIRRSPKRRWSLHGVLQRGEERLDAAAPAVVTRGGLIIFQNRVSPLDAGASFHWLAHFRKAQPVSFGEEEAERFLDALMGLPALPPLAVPEEWGYSEAAAQPRPVLRVRRANSAGPEKLRAELAFEYEQRVVPALDPGSGFLDIPNRRLLRRNREAEDAAAALLTDLGVRFQNPVYGEPFWETTAGKLPRAVRGLLEAGWHVEAEGKIFRRPGAFRIAVSSGLDWFDLHGSVEYGEKTAKIPELLEALRRGDQMVRLDDGTFGMLPEEWLRRFGMLAGMGTRESDHLRFRRSQAGLLDVLLAAQPEASCDETFARVREELRQFSGVEPAPQPAGFVGQLRDYQREGLGWMHFLRRFSFGGCLADDMGVGKTAQVLALLETRREMRAAGEPVAPSLVVVPKSLVFNWKQEALRFTPQLKILDYTGLSRNGGDFSASDVVLTTYGTVRRDALRLKDVEFDYIVLDEAQAVKNAATESSKSVRLLRGHHRLALSGTPVENHLGELWTLFEFLNPGMLGVSSVFKLSAGSARNPDEDTRRLLAQALRPFILRRTKEQVARELPPKTEQTIYCEMEPAQRKLYQELRQHYRDSLLHRIETEGLAKSKIQVLEALLRLRQAACHPGLIDKKRADEPSAKLEVLLEQIREVLDEGHKALVFSQFTSLLSIVRDRLETLGVSYEYLDGATGNRQECVERFQNDDDCRLFLISLKAGGLGLNLTAAEYVFLLDPWWNPAVEAQAVDRAHRIGQNRQVFAYRLIARDTVEEKVLELQKSKRDLAAAIISQDNSLIRSLRKEELELLLS
jgi:hypothetical protein